MTITRENAALKYHNLKVKLFRKMTDAKKLKIKVSSLELSGKNDTDGEKLKYDFLIKQGTSS
jgi:hypothetical protein